MHESICRGEPLPRERSHEATDTLGSFIILIPVECGIRCVTTIRF